MNPISTSWSTASFVTTGGPAGAAAFFFDLTGLPAARSSISSSVSISTSPALAAALSACHVFRSATVFSSNVCASGTLRLCRSI